MAMVNEAYGWKPEMLLVYVEDLGLHYICRYDGILYDATGYFIGQKYPYGLVILDRIVYDTAMWWGTFGYTKSIETF